MRESIVAVGGSIVFVLILFSLWSSKAEAERYEATGQSQFKHKSLPNALVAAHFECNRKGLWANLDTMEVHRTVSDKSKKPTYRAHVVFECSPHYQKDLPEKEE